MHGISALIRVPTGPPATFARWGHSENMTICEAGSEPSADSKPASTLILNFSASRTMRNKYLLFVSHPSYGIFVTTTWTDWHRRPALSGGFSVLLSLLLFYFLLSCSFSFAFPFLLSLYLFRFSLSPLLLFIHYIFKENINLKLCPCWSGERWIKEHNDLKPNCPRSLSLSVFPHPLQKMHHLLKNRKALPISHIRWWEITRFLVLDLVLPLEWLWFLATEPPEDSSTCPSKVKFLGLWGLIFQRGSNINVTC